MVSIFKNILKCGIPAALVFTLAAADTTVEFDPARSQVHFTVDSTLHMIHGTFKLKRGQIHFDQATGAASGAIVIDALSGESGNGSRDSRMNKSILETQKYPEITFTPQHVKGHVALQGDSQIEVEGIFNLHGKDHPMTLVAKVNAKDRQLTASTHFVVPYIQWGLKNPSTFILRVSDKVQIEIQATCHVAGGEVSQIRKDP